MRWLPFLLVILSAFAPVEMLADTIWGELVIRSIWSTLLVFTCYKLMSGLRPYLILCCEFWSIAYNLAIALGYFFADKDLGAWYAGTMLFLFCIELAATFPGVRLERRQDRDNSRRYGRRSFGRYDLSAVQKIAQTHINDSGLSCRL